MVELKNLLNKPRNESKYN